MIVKASKISKNIVNVLIQNGYKPPFNIKTSEYVADPTILNEDKFQNQEMEDILQQIPEVSYKTLPKEKNPQKEKFNFEKMDVTKYELEHTLSQMNSLISVLQDMINQLTNANTVSDLSQIQPKQSSKNNWIKI